MDLIDITAPGGSRRERYFARSTGTSFVAAAPSGDVREIDLYDAIGFWGVTAKDFRAQLKDAGDIVLRINSPGGDVFDGIAIYNDLVSHKGKVRVEISGVAASIASIIAMAGDEIVIADNAFFMIHNSSTIAMGNRHDFAEIAATMAKVDDAMARTYAARTGGGIRAIKQQMDDETWFTGKEAKEAGFATATASAIDAKAKFDLSGFVSTPEALLWAEEDEDLSTKRDIERAIMQDANWSRSKTRAAMRVLETSKSEVTPDADSLSLTDLAAALASARAAFTN